MSIQRVRSVPPSTSDGETGFSVAGLPQNPMDVKDANGRETPIWGYLIVTNESPVSMKWRVNTDEITISPWEKDKIVLKQRTDVITYLIDLTLSNSASAPVNTTIVDFYSADEPVSDQYPIPLVRSTSSVTTSFQAQELLGLSGGTVIYPDDETVSGRTNLQPNQYPTGTSATLDIGLDAKLNGTTDLHVLHSDAVNSRVHMDMKLALLLTTGTYLSGVQIVSGTGPGTPGHSLGVTPAAILISCSNGNSSNATVSTALWTSTQFNVYCSAGVDWVALVIV